MPAADPRMPRAATARALRTALETALAEASGPTEALESCFIAVLTALYPNVPVKRCAADDCGRPFVFPDTVAQTRQRVRAADAVYCSARCRTRQNNRASYARRNAERIARRARERAARAARSGPDRPAWSRIPDDVREQFSIGQPRSKP